MFSLESKRKRGQSAKEQPESDLQTSRWRSTTLCTRKWRNSIIGRHNGADSWWVVGVWSERWRRRSSGQWSVGLVRRLHMTTGVNRINRIKTSETLNPENSQRLKEIHKNKSPQSNIHIQAPQHLRISQTYRVQVSPKTAGGQRVRAALTQGGEDN